MAQASRNGTAHWRWSGSPDDYVKGLYISFSFSVPVEGRSSTRFTRMWTASFRAEVRPAGRREWHFEDVSMRADARQDWCQRRTLCSRLNLAVFDRDWMRTRAYALCPRGSVGIHTLYSSTSTFQFFTACTPLHTCSLVFSRCAHLIILSCTHRWLKNLERKAS